MATEDNFCSGCIVMWHCFYVKEIQDFLQLKIGRCYTIPQRAMSYLPHIYFSHSLSIKKGMAMQQEGVLK